VVVDARTCGIADFNEDGFTNPDDLSDYINCYFEIPACPGRRTLTRNGVVNPDDLSDYINEYFSTDC